MKVFINKGVNFDEVEEILSKVNAKNVEPNLFVKAKVEDNDVTFYTMEGNEILFTLDSTVLKGWEKLYSEYIGIINIPNKSFEFTVFSELHTHSEYSILDGANKIKDIAKKYPYSGALTDHGVIYGWIEFYKAMKDNYKHPLMGCEVYTKGIKGDEGKYHLILLAMNEKGANNIIRISSEAQEHENYGGKFPQRPLVSYDMLEKYSEGVICLSACMGGEIPRKILADDTEGVVEVLTKMKSIFGENYYLEIQRHGNEDVLKERILKKTGMTVAVAKADAKRDEEGFIKTYGKYIYQDLFYIEEENKVNDALLKYSKEFDIKLVATNDAHYLNKEDASTHEALLCNQTKKTMTDINHWSFSGIGYHIHTSEEMEELFKDIPEVLINTLEVSNKCNYEIEFGNYKLPKFDIPAPFKSEFEYLKDRAYAGYESRYSKTSMYKDPERIERMKYELSVIEKMGYASYFLIVWDFIRYAKENGIAVGPGRGSAAGSLVCYCLGITELDPIPYNLLFEREDCAR